jgi:gp16 family phage-associated protein
MVRTRFSMYCVRINKLLALIHLYRYHWLRMQHNRPTGALVMDQKAVAKRGFTTNAAAMKKNVLTPEEVKTRLSEDGKSLRQWAKEKGYPYQTVSQVVRGVNRGSYGMGYRIAVELGLKNKEAK